MKKTMTILIGGILAAVLQAMSTPAQLEKARPIIQELMAEDFAALKSGKKNAEDVGDAAMKLAANAETEAAKFLLCKAAFGLYIRGKSYDKAADVLETFRESISDLLTIDYDRQTYLSKLIAFVQLCGNVDVARRKRGAVDPTQDELLCLEESLKTFLEHIEQVYAQA